MLVVELGEEQAQQLPNRSVVVDMYGTVWQRNAPTRWLSVVGSVAPTTDSEPRWPVRLMVLADVATTEQVLDACEVARNVAGGWFE